MKRSFILLCATILAVSAFITADNSSRLYLLTQEILDVLGSGELISFKNKDICEERISVNLESPFDLYGYMHIDEFIHDFSLEFSQFETENIGWVSSHLEEEFAVQSLNIELKNKRSQKIIYYKFIFFLIKKAEKWKIYYIRGLEI